MYSNDPEILDTHLNNYFANFSFKDFFAKLTVNLTDYSLMQFHILATLTSRSKPASGSESGSGLSLIKDFLSTFVLFNHPHIKHDHLHQFLLPVYEQPNTNQQDKSVSRNFVLSYHIFFCKYFHYYGCHFSFYSN